MEKLEKQRKLGDEAFEGGDVMTAINIYQVNEIAKLDSRPCFSTPSAKQTLSENVTLSWYSLSLGHPVQLADRPAAGPQGGRRTRQDLQVDQPDTNGS